MSRFLGKIKISVAFYGQAINKNAKVKIWEQEMCHLNGTNESQLTEAAPRNVAVQSLSGRAIEDARCVYD